MAKKRKKKSPKVVDPYTQHSQETRRGSRAQPIPGKRKGDEPKHKKDLYED